MEAGAALTSGWWLTLCLGAVVILLFSGDRLNRPLDPASDTQRRRERLVALLQPVHMGRRSLFLRGYVFYTGLLLLVFVVASFGSSFVGPFLIPNAQESIGGPEWPLMVALVMTGLLPGLKPFERVERKIRAYAHVLAGVPESFHSFADALLQVELDDDRLGYDLVGAPDARRLELILARARRVFGAGAFYDRFANRTAKLFAFQAWAAGAMEWPSYETRQKFRNIEMEITAPILAVIADLEDLAAAGPAEDDDTAVPDTLVQRWQHIDSRVTQAADDSCALFALYAEHATELPVRDNPVSALLRQLIEAAERRRRSARPEADVIYTAVIAVAALAFAIGYLGAVSDLLYGNTPLGVATGYFASVLIIYGPASYLAWSARHPRHPADWSNAYLGRGVPPTRQYLGLLLVCYLATVCSLSFFTLVDAAVTHVGNVGVAAVDPAVVIDQFFGRLPAGAVAPELCETGKDPQTAKVWFALAYGTVGAAHGVVFALMGDAVDARRENGAGVRLIALHGTALALLSLLAAQAIDRTTPCMPGDGEVAARLGLKLDLAEELVAFEMLAAFLLGLAFAAITRFALVRLRDGRMQAARVAPAPAEG